MISGGHTGKNVEVHRICCHIQIIIGEVPLQVVIGTEALLGELFE